MSTTTVTPASRPSLITAPRPAFTSLGDLIENLRPDELRISPALARRRLGRTSLANVPSNQQAVDAMKAFYAAHQPVVDNCTTDTKNGSQNNPSFVGTMNGYNWNNQQLSGDEQDTTNNAIFESSQSGPGNGIWTNTLDAVNADTLFTTIAAGVNADVQFFIGGAGGLGCAWDIAKREGPRGYGFATGELGLRIVTSLNLQALVFNQLPSDLDMDCWGVKVSIDSGISVSFSVFFQNATTTPLGFAIGLGMGLGGGATVFGGHIWNF